MMFNKFSQYLKSTFSGDNPFERSGSNLVISNFYLFNRGSSLYEHTEPLDLFEAMVNCKEKHANDIIREKSRKNILTSSDADKEVDAKYVELLLKTKKKIVDDINNGKQVKSSYKVHSFQIYDAEKNKNESRIRSEQCENAKNSFLNAMKEAKFNAGLDVEITGKYSTAYYTFDSTICTIHSTSMTPQWEHAHYMAGGTNYWPWGL